jgi:hypothetical protein
MADAVTLRSLEVDLATNSLRLILAESAEGRGVETLSESATIDVGAGGRLVGVELPNGYVDVMPPEPGTDHLIRSSTAEIGVERVGTELVALVVPRLGAGYEITYPSGNQ